MKITNVLIYRSKDGGNFLGYVSIQFDHCLVVKNFKLMNGRNGIFVNFPQEKLSKPDKDGKEYGKTVYSENKDFTDYVNQEVVRAYNSVKVPTNDMDYQKPLNSGYANNSYEDPDSMPF